MSSSGPNDDSERKKSPVFLLKTRSTPHDGYDEYFSSRAGYAPSFIPVLEHKFNDTNLNIVRDLFVSGKICQKYGGLIFTSQRAVEGFARMMQAEVEQSISAAASRFLTFYAVGPATHRSLSTLRDSHLPYSEVIGRDAGTGEQLAGLILGHYNELYERRKAQAREPQQQDGEPGRTSKLPLLFLVGEQHRDVIPKTLMSPDLTEEKRIQVDELIVYETGVMESFAADFETALKNVGAWDDEDSSNYQNKYDVKGESAGNGGYKDDNAIWIVVFSPTGCDTMLRTLNLLPFNETGRSHLESGRGRKFQKNCYIATIGPTTRDHLRKFGIEPQVCAVQPSPEGVGAGIENFMVEKRKKKG
ncbi:hypothetical protein VTO42DRAFT_7556 [Malbranchea cinnamomea]